MVINEKDRGQLLRMAGNIACGLVTGANPWDVTDEWGTAVANLSAGLALKSMQSVDAMLAERAKGE